MSVHTPEPKPEPCEACDQPANYIGMDETLVAFKCAAGHYVGRARRPDDGMPKCDQCERIALRCKPCSVSYCEACDGHVCPG